MTMRTLAASIGGGFFLLAVSIQAAGGSSLSEWRQVGPLYPVVRSIGIAGGDTLYAAASSGNSSDAGIYPSAVFSSAPGCLWPKDTGSIRNWVCQADLDEGRRSDGLTSEEKEELTRLRRENRRLTGC